ncbi:unnamed protein product, partial [Symbiodinium necroappetens]
MTSASEERDLAPASGGQVADRCRRPLSVVGFLGISDYGLGQLEVLASRYEVAFATAKKHAAAHATGLDQKLDTGKACIPYLGSVDANSSSMVDRASRTDLVVIGGYVARPLPLCEPAGGFRVRETDDDVGGDDDYDGMAVAQNLRRFEEASEPWVLPNSLGPAAWLMAYGVAQLFPGCSACPEINGKKGIHYVPGRLDAVSSLQVGEAIDHGPILDMFEAPGLGGMVQNNRQVQRFPAALERFSAGEELAPCQGVDIYHKKGMPNDGWLSFYWSDDFLIRFSLAMDFAPYLPGRTRVEEGGEAIALAVEAACAALEDSAAEGAAVGEVLDADEGLLLVKTRLGVLRCRQLTGTRVTKGGLLISGRPLEQSAAAGPCPHAIPMHFSGQ